MGKWGVHLHGVYLLAGYPKRWRADVANFSVVKYLGLPGTHVIVYITVFGRILPLKIDCNEVSDIETCKKSREKGCNWKLEAQKSLLTPILGQSQTFVRTAGQCLHLVDQWTIWTSMQCSTCLVDITFGTSRKCLTMLQEVSLHITIDLWWFQAVIFWRCAS